MANPAKSKALESKKRSKFEIEDRGDPRHTSQQFVPKRSKDLFDKKEPTYKQFFDEIKHLGNIRIYHKGKQIAERGM